MTTYAVVRKVDQIEVYRYTNDEPVEWQGMGFNTHDHIVVPDVASAPPPPIAPKEWESFTFLRRFTQAERLAIRAARKTDEVLDDFFCLLEKAIIVHSDDADMSAGMGYLVYKNLLTPARRDVILGTSNG